jgi:multidrug efflux system membrane fusion protein
VQAVFATGTVEPTVMIPIAPRTGARLVQLLADEGAEVKKGDILGQLEDTDVQKSIDQLNANLDLAQKEFDRKDKLRKSGAVSKQAIDSAKGALDAATAALEQAKAQQDYLRLVAPEDGRIIKRDGEAGQFIPSGQAVFWMECCAPCASPQMSMRKMYLW